jgi:hypothetical protein
LVSRFFLVAESKNDNRVGSLVAHIKCDVSGVTKWNQQFAHCGIICEWAAYFGRCLKQRKMLTDCCGGPPCSFGILWREKVSAAIKSCSGGRRNDYLWHSGASVS